MSPDYTLLEFNEVLTILSNIYVKTMLFSKVPPSDEEAKFQSFLTSYTRTYTNDVKRESIDMGFCSDLLWNFFRI